MGPLPIPLRKEDRKTLRLMSRIHSSSHRQAGAPIINIQSKLRNTPICVKMFHSRCYFGSKGIIHKQSLCGLICVCLYIFIYIHIYFCVYTHTHTHTHTHTKHRRWLGKRNKPTVVTAVNAACHFGHARPVEV